MKTVNLRIYLLAVGTFALGTDLFVIVGVLPSIAQDQSVSIDTAGLLVTVFSLVYGFGAPVLAATTSHISRHKLLLIVLLGFSVSNLLSAISPTFPILMITRIIAACFAALYTPAATAVAAALASPEQRGQALAIVLGGLTAATVLGVPTGTTLGKYFGWPVTFLFIAALGMLAFLALLILKIKHIPSAPAIKIKDRVAPLTNPKILLALLPTAVWTGAGLVTYTFISPLLLQNTHISDPTFLLFFYGFGGVVGSWLGGYLADRIGSNLPITLSLLVLIIILATFPFITTTVIGASVALALWGTLAWVLYAPQQHRLLAIAPKVPTNIIALNSSATYLGIAAGSARGSLIISQTSVLMLAPISAIFGFVSLVIYVISSIISPKPKGESTPAAAAPAPVPATVASSLHAQVAFSAPIPAQIVFTAPEPAQVAFSALEPAQVAFTTPAMTEH